jgi:hypothetical protein
LNGTWLAALAGLVAEKNTAMQVRSVRMMRLVILSGVFIAAVSFYRGFAFMVVVLVPGEPGDADRFPFLPETLRRVAKKVWNRCCVSVGRRYVFGVDLAHRN